MSERMVKLMGDSSYGLNENDVDDLSKISQYGLSKVSQYGLAKISQYDFDDNGLGYRVEVGGFPDKKSVQRSKKRKFSSFVPAGRGSSHKALQSSQSIGFRNRKKTPVSRLTKTAQREISKPRSKARSFGLGTAIKKGRLFKTLKIFQI